MIPAEFTVPRRHSQILPLTRSANARVRVKLSVRLRLQTLGVVKAGNGDPWNDNPTMCTTMSHKKHNILLMSITS